MLALTSSMAAITAGLADLPMIEFKVNSTPILRTLGLEETVEFEMVVPVLPTTSMGIQEQNTNRNKTTLLMNMLPCLVNKSTSIFEKSTESLRFAAQVFSFRPASEQSTCHMPTIFRSITKKNNRRQESSQLEGGTHKDTLASNQPCREQKFKVENRKLPQEN